MKIERQPQARAYFGIGRSMFYAQCKEGLITRPIRLGTRATGWPSDELIAIAAARVAGKQDDEIRALVCRLHAGRAEKGAHIVQLAE